MYSKRRRRRTENNNKCRNLERRLKWRLFFFIPHSFGVEEAAVAVKPLLDLKNHLPYTNRREMRTGRQVAPFFTSSSRERLIYPKTSLLLLPSLCTRFEGDNAVCTQHQEKWLSKMCVLEGFMAAFTIFSKRFSVNIHPPSCSHTTHETGENNDKSSNSQVLTKILNYELIHKNQQQPQDLRHRVVPNSYLTVNAALFLRVHPVLWQY